MKLRLREFKPFSQSNTVSDGGKTWDAWFFHLQSLEFWLTVVHGGAEAIPRAPQGGTELRKGAQDTEGAGLLPGDPLPGALHQD